VSWPDWLGNGEYDGEYGDWLAGWV